MYNFNLKGEILFTRKQFTRLSAMGLMLSGSLIYAGSSTAKIPKNSLTQQQGNTVKRGGKVLDYKESEVIVKFKKNVEVLHATGMINSLGIDVAKEFKTLSKAKKQAYMLVRSKSLSTEELIAKLKADPNVEYAEPNHLYKLDSIPNDPMFDQLWGQHNTGQSIDGTSGTPDADMDAPEAWEISTGSSNVVVAVIDTGVDYLHEDLAVNMWKNSNEIPDNGIDDDSNGYVDDVYGINAANNTGDPMDLVAEGGSHGTHVAGTIAAVGDNGKGVVGVSWNARIMALKFILNGSGWSSDAIECLEYVIEQKNAGVNIVATNNSWGGGGFSVTLKDAIEATNNLGILFTAAAGNSEIDNDSDPHYPSSYDLPGIIAVASTDQDDELVSTSKHYYGSNYGATSVDIAAPGINILSSIPTSGYAYYGGTSMATPQISGAIAILAGIDTGDSIASRKARILDSVDTLDSLDGKVVTGGRLNLKSAINTGTCPEGEHHKQGTLTCIPDTVPEFTPPYLADYDGLIQGTTDTDPNADPGADLTLDLPKCEGADEGKRLIQGTDTCVDP